jgi:hypothetical protein
MAVASFPESDMLFQVEMACDAVLSFRKNLSRLSSLEANFCG